MMEQPKGPDFHLLLIDWHTTLSGRCSNASNIVNKLSCSYNSNFRPLKRQP
jgi:hypothetical protein